jgi:hypothetical protein
MCHAAQDTADPRLFSAPLAQLTRLRHLHLADGKRFYLLDSSPLAALQQLESFKGAVRHLDVAHLGPGMTRLQVMVQSVADSGRGQQQQQQHVYPQLLHLDLQLTSHWRQPHHTTPAAAPQATLSLLALFEPALQQVQHLGCTALMEEVPQRGRHSRKFKRHGHRVHVQHARAEGLQRRATGATKP